MASRSYLFYFCDPVASFSAGSPGLKKRQITGTWGDRLGAEAWDLGRRAYTRLCAVAGSEVSVEDLLRVVDDTRPFHEEFFEALNAKALAGKIELMHEDGVTPLELPLKWREAEWSWQVMTTVKFLNDLPSAADVALAESFGVQMLVAALLSLDAAVLHSLDDDSARMSACLLDAAWLVDQVESQERHERDARALLKRLERARASDRAKLRHARDPKRKARDFVRECWENWRRSPATYPSASAFARAMLDKQPDLLTSEVVVSRWVRGWDRETKAEPLG